MSQSTAEPQVDITDLPSIIFRHWIHSREEDANGLEVYRPEGFDFPPSFGRDGFRDVRGRSLRPGGHRSRRRHRPDRRPLGADRPPPGRGVVPRAPTGRATPSRSSTSTPTVLRIRRGPAVDEPYGYTTCQPMDDQHMAAYDALPPATTSKRLDFSVRPDHHAGELPAPVRPRGQRHQALRQHGRGAGALRLRPPARVLGDRGGRHAGGHRPAGGHPLPGLDPSERHHRDPGRGGRRGHPAPALRPAGRTRPSRVAASTGTRSSTVSRRGRPS